ncbi:gamma-glutamyltranspeptidase / glutathione hydrolase [Actinopolymorpha cephalotaxi]|uniref:Glutathione hydrolase proenzyme n=1 Tax=Actinopolymorpha cephalotaxi TaxID=504797 RepID=A0A1I2QZ25_9ACTN|nr:gamma-glutamyltransferase [Actinopolymorpha cephalotaxi]NYH82412.1 gamma-glutamyltranspeptidase/glutathione hydrolase [Actinopolymorpha cephalotaxi]SFG33745.1 gamma-glutamyltranspeptidase / glutathione hydrolase [Actinopolymorpha cephalotaxi]
MRRSVVVTAVGALVATAALGPVAAADPPRGHQPRNEPAKTPVARGYGGGVATVDPDATRAGIDVLRRGGNAVDAAVAAAATLGVTEPFSAGLGGGGFFVFYDAKSGKVHTIDGRETAPASATDKLFVDPETGKPLSFQDARVSGLSVGVPGTPATWDRALDKWGTWSLRQALAPATRVASRGFVVDGTFRSQIQENADVFDDFTSTRKLYLPDGAPPVVGSVFRNRDLAHTYRMLAHEGMKPLYDGELGADIARTVQHPPVTADADRVVRPGAMTTGDLAAYDAPLRAPTKVGYRGMDVFGMGPPSSGGSTVGEALNIIEAANPGHQDKVGVLHTYLEASALAFADRNRYVGDRDQVDVPLPALLSQGFADERACEIRPDAVLKKPVAPGVPDGEYAAGCGAKAAVAPADQHEGPSTTHLTASDRWGNVVSYTLTIEQTGGSGMVVPGRGFLLNNELTDFNFEPTQGDAPDPNLPGPGKRPRSSMSPTIVIENGQPVLALGSPGGATIITTVLQTLVNRYELGMSLPDAVAAPRASSRNTALEAEPAFLASAEGKALTAKGHTFKSVPEIGAETALQFGQRGAVEAVAEPTRRGGGSAMVVLPTGGHHHGHVPAPR